ncbi:DnaB-like helicase C-terminal domain-containing protein [Campylobacter canadensis]|uniref:DNA 5'-3' helicase n=1 Tax=Campylobacter canadensis TaxID=449520 RepID=A0ABS7WTT7_9BACT|nr:DnaB-like helicase C-terminal domain-containing protein [Campylobacter canadensis]MBZ7987717.1 AAA family ATPase [Campylobacter canadensis]MBZ7994124.1 AAA family ATPase [Campylobacter canadensis]MBZ7995873.1 AAA family ATPase [Campylobacter canadensis]MBZ7997510.1 AAA family ATPase [Campylobacter canadensis]MBZ7999455.1 AAA family ATPase [Campylobacter canadensis]
MSKFSDIELEQSILLACVYNNEHIDTAASILKESDFALSLNARIFTFLKNKRRLGENTDLKQLKLNFLDIKDDFWNEFEIKNSMINVLDYCKTLKDLSIKDQLNALLSTTLGELANTQNTVEFTNSLSARIYNILSGVSNTSLKSASVAISEFYEELARVSSLIDKNIIGVDTGFSELNRLTKGFKAGELIILAARPGVGKTTFALNLALNALKKDCGVVFYSLETEAYKIMTKLISSHSSILLQDIITAQLDDIQQVELQESANYLSSKTFFTFDRGELNIEILRSSLRRLKEENPQISLCIIDYIQLMTSLNVNAPRHIQVSEISRGLKLLALELKIPILALSQVNRGVDSRTDKKLFLSDIRESGSIEQDADAIMFLYETQSKEENSEQSSSSRKITLDIAKNRSGDLKQMFLEFDAAKSRFRQIQFDNSPQNTISI